MKHFGLIIFINITLEDADNWLLLKLLIEICEETTHSVLELRK